MFGKSNTVSVICKNYTFTIFICLIKPVFNSYRHAFDGLRQIYKYEGLKGLFAGASMATGRSILMTIGQLCFYDQCKSMLMTYVDMKDTVVTHFTASIFAVS